MNSVKNAIVTMTLLAVGYGAYVVLSNPLPEDVGELAEGTVWETPEVTAPTTDLGSDSTAPINEPPPLDAPSGTSAVAHTDGTNPGDLTLPQNITNGEVANVTTPPYDDSPVNSTRMPRSSEPIDNELSLTTPAATNVPSAAARQHDAANPNDSNANFYVSHSGGASATDETYPNTNSPEMPLPPPSNDDGAPDPNSLAPQDTLPGGFEDTWQSVQADLVNGQLGTALASLSAWYEEPALTPQQQERLLPLLDQLAGSVIYSRDSFLEPAHVVQNGETLKELAQMYQVPLNFLARVNGIDPPYEIFPGESIKVIRGPFRAEINRRLGQITLFLGRYYAGRFQARVGAELPAEENTYDVVTIEPGLEFFDSRTGQRIARDDPANPYGPVWISLRGNQVTAAHNVGIHVDKGDPKRCCIGVSPGDADDLAAILGPGSSIHVHD